MDTRPGLATMPSAGGVIGRLSDVMVDTRVDKLAVVCMTAIVFAGIVTPGTVMPVS